MKDEGRGAYNSYSQIKFKTGMVKSSFCDCSDTYIDLKGTITITDAELDVSTRQSDERNKQLSFKNCAPFTDCIR